MTDTTTPVSTADAVLDMKVLSYLSLILPDDHRGDDNKALEFLMTLDPQQARAALMHDDPSFQKDLLDLFKRAIKTVPYLDLLTISDQSDKVAAFLEKIAAAGEDLPICIGSLFGTVWDAVRHAHMEINRYPNICKTFTVPEECLKKVQVLTRAVLNLGIPKLIKLANTLLPNYPYSSYCIIRMVSRFSEDEAKADLKSFILNRYQSLPRMRYEEADIFNDAILCLVEAGITVADQDLPWNKIIESICQAYLRRYESIFEESPLSRLVVLAEKVASLHKDRTIKGGPATAKCFLGNRYGRIVFDNAGIPQIVGAWLVPQALKRERVRRGHLGKFHRGYELVKIDNFYITPMLCGVTKKEQRPLEIYFAGEKVKKGSQEEVVFANYLLSHIEKAEQNIETKTNCHATLQWSKMVLYYGKKFIKAIFYHLEEAPRKVHGVLEYQPYKIFVKKTLEESSLTLFESHLRDMASAILTTPEQQYDYENLPFKRTLSFMGPKLFAKYLSVLLELAWEKVDKNEEEKVFVFLRQLRLFCKIFKFVNVDDPLAVDIMEFVMQKTLSVRVMHADTEIIAAHVKFWEAAIAAGLKNSNLRNAAIRFLIDVAYNTEPARYSDNHAPLLTLNILPALLKQIIALGEVYPQNLLEGRHSDCRANEYQGGPEAFFRDNAIRLLKGHKGTTQIEAIDSIDVINILKTGSNSLKSVALEVAFFRLKLEKKDTLGEIVYEYITSIDTQHVEIAFKYIKLLYCISSDEIKSDILIKLIALEEKSAQNPKKLLHSLSYKGLPYGVKENSWKEKILDIHLEAVDENYDYSCYQNEGKFIVLCTLCDWDIKTLLRRITLLERRGQKLLKATSEYLTSNLGSVKRRVSQQEFLEMLTTI